jgi:hypothetical protein
MTDKTKKETIVVDKAALGALLKEIEELKAGQVRLEHAADVSRLDNYDTKHKAIGPRQYRLTIYDGKLITGWRTVTDKSWMDGNVLRNQQEYEIIFGDNTKMAVKGYDNFATIRHGFRVIAEKVSEKADDYGKTLTLKILGVADPKNQSQGPEYDAALPLFGTEVILDERFVN